MAEKLKIGFLADQLEVGFYVFDVINHVAENHHFDVPIIIHGHVDAPLKVSFIRRFFETVKRKGLLGFVRAVLFYFLYLSIKKIETRSLIKKHPEAFKKFKLDDIKEIREIKIDGIWSDSKLLLNFSKSDLQKIKNEDLDLIIRCGGGILKGDVLKAPRLGVLSFHHGDNRTNRGGPAGFWEVINDESSSGFIIQKLSEELDGGDILLRGNIMTSSTWHSNTAQLLAKSNFFLKKMLNEIAESGQLPLAEGPFLHDKPLYKLKSSRFLAKYIWRVWIPLIKSKLINKILGREVIRWSVAFAKNHNFQKSLWRYKEINNPDGRFLADPFVIQHDGKTVIFVEDWFYSDSKGRISAIDITNNKEKFLGVVLEEDFHLSFPYVFKSDSKIYMIPETFEAKEIRLYECTNFPLQWQLKKILMEDVSAVDTMLIRKSEKWFMLTNICSAGVGDYLSELHIYWADSADSRNWKPLANGNPVIFDSEKARNGGFFFCNNTLYRINQIQGKSHYGKAFGINIVDKLDEKSYKETRIQTINTEFKKQIVATHHFNANDQVAVVDYGRKERLKKILRE